MSYLNTHTRTSKPTNSDKQLPLGRLNKYFGVYLGFIKDAKDVQKNGRLRVWVPELASSPDDPQGWVIANYCSPFAGATNVETASENNIESFETTQTSYGFWMVPPDINNEVLVMFINGDVGRPIWIGCLYNQFANNMIPAMASSENNYQYKDKFIPVAEYNRWDTSVTNPDLTRKPYEKTKFKGVSNQGLINDKYRGVTTTSARRESPSSVFGIITPGPAIEDTLADNTRRKGGSSFIMDDGIGTEYIQLATKSGASIKIDETQGFIYLINRDGSAWVQMDKEGNIDIFGAKNISMRAQRDFNIRADRNINLEAGQNIFIKAAKDTIESETQFEYDAANTSQIKNIQYFKYVGENNGNGGIIALQAVDEFHSTSKNNSYFTSTDGNLHNAAKISSFTTAQEGGINFTSKSGIKMTTEGAFDLSTNNNIRMASAGSVSIVSSDDLVFCSNSNISVNSSGEIIITSASKISADATSVEIGTDVKMQNLDASAITSSSINSNSIISSSLQSQNIKAVSTETNSIKSDTKSQNNQEIGGGYNGGAASPSSPSTPAPSSPISSESPIAASVAGTAEIKAVIDKVNILATWKQSLDYQSWKNNTPYKAGDIVFYNQTLYVSKKYTPPLETFETSYWSIFIPEDKFKRNAESLQTTVTRLPTYEPCPEHSNFNFNNISGYKPLMSNGDITYIGSGGTGNNPTNQPIQNNTDGINNLKIPQESIVDTVISKDINLSALKCQLIAHEGLKKNSYLCSANKLTGGIGHLLRSPDEVTQYPLGAQISDEQIEKWYQLDIISSIKGAQKIIGIDTWSELSDIRKRALVDLVYNLGDTGFSKFKNTIISIKDNNWQLVGENLRNSAWYSQVGKRANNIITMFVKNIDPLGCDIKNTEENNNTGGIVIIGDSIGIGISQFIPNAITSVSQNNNSSKAKSSVIINTKLNNAKIAIISIGTNDVTNGTVDAVKLKDNLKIIKASIKAEKYVWILPYNRNASDVIMEIAGKDKKIDLIQYATDDGIYPTNYKSIAADVLAKG